MPRRGDRKPKQIAGDPADPAGFPMLVAEFLESMGVRGYSPRTIENHHAALGYLAAWLQERGIGRPAEVTKPMLDGYQRHLFHRRKPDGTPLSFRAQHTRLVPIRAFFKWLARGNRILYNPPRSSSCQSSNAACPERSCRPRRPSASSPSATSARRRGFAIG